MKRTRNSLSYKVKMWFYRLTCRDIKYIVKIIFSFMLEFIIIFLGFISIFILPAFFH